MTGLITNVVFVFVLYLQSKANQYASKALEKFDIRIEFVSNAVNAPNIVRRFWRDLEFVPEVTDMVVYRPAGVVVKIFVPYQVYYHVIGKYPAGIHDKQSKDVKLFHRQHNLGVTNIYQSVF